MNYTDCQISDQKIPGEICLIINTDSHSGKELDEEILDNLIPQNVSCICFSADDKHIAKLLSLNKHIKETFPKLKTALFSNQDEIRRDCYEVFDYVKIGHYDELYGPINLETTNQRLYRCWNGALEDITRLLQIKK